MISERSDIIQSGNLANSRRWDELHCLGFRQLAGRGLRCVAAWNGRWLALPD